MRRNIILILLAVLVLAGLGALYLVPWYQTLYHTPAIRYDHKVFACEDAAGDVQRFTDGQSTFTFTPTVDGTEVTIDFAYYAPASFVVTEHGQAVTVSRADGTKALSGIWRGGELIDPQTDSPQSTYAFEILSDTPSASFALWLYEEQKDGIRGRPGVGSGILLSFCASFAGLTGLRFPHTKTEKQMLAQSPKLRRGMLVFFCIFPFAAIPVILYWGVT
ncbi:MAG: hypothetical protein Q3Y08_00155 [Butyricicoccus sp.]|nr:hypothetical protein [Butyricicoccus sp.]